jgi:5-formyltetrahydrofolate cyclo-ligase
MAGLGDQGVDQLRLAKQAIRKRVLAARAAIDVRERERISAVVTSTLIELAELQGASCVLAYLSFGDELSTDGLIAALQERDRALVLPRINRAAHRLELYRVRDTAADTMPGVWGIREPDPSRCPPATLDEIELIVVPGVAFTPAGDRLGYGGGYYDELLTRWQRPPPRVALAFDVQLVDELPTSARDQPVDVIVTQSALFRRPRS